MIEIDWLGDNFPVLSMYEVDFQYQNNFVQWILQRKWSNDAKLSNNQTAQIITNCQNYKSDK